MTCKYIITDDGPIVFPQTMSHAEVAGRRKCSSAGLCHFYSEAKLVDGSLDSHVKISCWGESITLKLSSKESEDAKEIEQYLLRDY